MKKTLLSIGLLSAMAFSANAQDAATAAPSSSELKAGSVTVELNMASPFSGGGAEPFSLNNNALRFRYFLSETMAFRLGFSIDRAGFNKTYGTKTETSSTAAGAQASGSEDTKVNVKSSMFQFSIMPGLEFHKLVSDRLSVYYGGYFEFTLNSQKATAEVTPGSSTSAGVTTKTNDGSFKKEWKGASLEEPSEDVTLAGLTAGGTGAGTVSRAETPGFTRLGLIGVIGADYYFTKGLYLGAEVSWGITGTTYKAVETTTTDSIVPVGATSVTTTSKVTDLDKNKAGMIAPAANAAIRFGFRF
jgi:hypothetical protein